MKKLLSLVLILLTTYSYSVAEQQEIAFITKLGNDTLAVETFSKTKDTITAKVVLRSPSTNLKSYYLTLDETGGIKTMVVYQHTPEEGFDGERRFFQQIERNKDSLGVGIMRQGEMRLFSVLNQEGTLPFIDMVHWPFELTLVNAQSNKNDTTIQKMLSGSRISNFVVANLGEDKRTIRHPSRGVMDVIVNEEGELVTLNAAQTTRKLVVTRTQNIDIDQISARFVALDEQGKSFGALSGAVEEEFEIKGVRFNVSYGSPSRRGRDLFGSIVPWGERWRTGANRATHFSVSEDLMIGELLVPAGDYTLFTIPESDGGTLIINKQTGQNGRSYNEDRDLGRVPMQISTNTDNTEVFTIEIQESTSGGELRLLWGETVFTVPFTVR